VELLLHYLNILCILGCIAKIKIRYQNKRKESVIEYMDYYTTILIVILFFELVIKKTLISSSGVWLLTFFVVNVLSPILTGIYYDYATIAIRIGITGFAIGLNVAFLINKHKGVKIENQRDISFHNILVIRNFSGIISVLLYLITYGVTGVNNLIIGNITKTETLSWQHSSIETIADILLQVFLYFAVFVFLFDKQDRNKVKNAFVIIVSMVIVSVFSYARFPIIIGLGIIAFYYLSKLSIHKQIIISIIAIFLGIIGMILLGIIRTVGLHAFLSDIDYYLTEIPLEHYINDSLDFQGGYVFFVEYLQKMPDFRVGPSAFFKILYTVVPRTIWPNKPDYLTLQILAQLHPERLATGFSCGYGILGEAYATLGWFGIFIEPLIFGVICGCLDVKYKVLRRQNNHSRWMILYLIFSTVVLVTVARGGIADSYTMWLPLVLIVFFASSIKRTSDKRLKMYITIR